MELTKWQINLLKFYQKYESAAPPLASMLGRFVLSWVVLCILIASLSAFYLRAGWPNVAWLFIGMGFGVLFRDFGSIRAFYRSWPVWQQIIHWARVARLLGQSTISEELK